MAITARELAFLVIGVLAVITIMSAGRWSGGSNAVVLSNEPGSVSGAAVTPAKKRNRGKKKKKKAKKQDLIEVAPVTEPDEDDDDGDDDDDSGDSAGPQASAVVPAPQSKVRNPLQGKVATKSPSPEEIWEPRSWKGQGGTTDSNRIKKYCKQGASDTFIDVVAKMAADEDGKDLHTVIDVGGNLGAYTEEIFKAAHMAGAKIDNIVAFEPNVELRKKYDERVAGALQKYGGKSTNLTVVQAGIGADNDYLTFFIGTASGKSGFAKAKTKWHTGETLKIPVERLDTFFLRNPQLLPVDFLKIDVEGLEMRVLRGATALLKCPDCVDMIQFEFGGAWKDDRCPEQVALQQVIGMLDKLGYDSYLTLRNPKDGMVKLNKGSTAQHAHAKCGWINVVSVRRTSPRHGRLQEYVKVY